MTDGPTSPNELPLLLGPGRGEPESLLLIAAPDAAGNVLVRRWSANDWSAPAEPRRDRAEALLAWLEQQHAAGRTMNQAMYALRLWLRGEGPR